MAEVSRERFVTWFGELASIGRAETGWNRLAWTKQAYARFPGLPDAPFVYFVHSYYPVPIDRSIIAATTTYGEEFVAAIVTDYLFATQFHPEKSQENGLAILRQFVSSLT